MGFIIYMAIIFKIFEIIVTYMMITDGDIKTRVDFWLTIVFALIPFSLLISFMIAIPMKLSNFYKSLPK